MNIMCWNCRGLGQPRAVNALQAIVNKYSPSILFLSETKLSRARFELVRCALGYNNALVVESIGASGGLALLWNNDCNLSVTTYNVGHIDAIITDLNSSRWRFTGFYGNPVVGERHHSWNLLRHLHDSFDLPWLVAGDFNEILVGTEQDGPHPRPMGQMVAFQRALRDCDLIDLGYVGASFTWNRRPDGMATRVRLDRGVSNAGWKALFPQHSVYHLSTSISDHVPILISSVNPFGRQAVKWTHIPRFDPYWVKDTEFEARFISFWRAGHISTSSLIPHITRVRSGLRVWSKKKHGHIRDQISQREESLRLLRESSTYTAAMETELLGQLDHWYTLNEEYWRQRGRSDWLKSMDRNTSYFHHKASARRARNTIHVLHDEAGVLFDTPEGMEMVASEYFTQIYSSNGIVPDLGDLGFSELTVEQQTLLSGTFTAAEVVKALKQLPGKKSPGPDGMHVIFLQKYWRVVGDDVLRVVLDVLNNDAPLGSINETYTCLLPKVKIPTVMTEFRPISLCNSIYKLISRVVVNRLKPVMGDVISGNQSAFVTERLMTDNAIIAFEAFHSLLGGELGTHNHAALKLDMAKAFDRVEWQYMWDVMERMCFPPALIGLIRRCITSVTYRVLVNGKPGRRVIPTRGIRQGDPLSPFLFIICAEGFTALLNAAASSGLMRGIRFGHEQDVIISHLFFADDSLIFFEDTEGAVEGLLALFDRYGSLSGQTINFHKSGIFFSRLMGVERREEISAMLHVPLGDESGKYLGMPLVVGRNKRQIFMQLKEKMWKKMSGWKDKMLSPAGNEVLIKSGVQSLLTFHMQCFKLPITLLQEMEKDIRAFFWGDTDNKKKIHWKNWETCCLPKGMGGLGFRDLECFNLAMLAKQAWRLITNPESLSSQVLRAKYFEEETILTAIVGTRPSFMWRSIVEGRDLLKAGLRWRVGDGESIFIFDQAWTTLAPTFKLMHTTHTIHPDSMVSRLFDLYHRRWDVDFISAQFQPWEVDAILATPLAPEGHPDKLIWHYDPKGKYTVKSGYFLALQLNRPSMTTHASTSSGVDNLWRECWKLKVQPRINHFLWRCLQDCLPIGQGLLRRTLGDGVCLACGDTLETLRHVLFECEMARRIWQASSHAYVLDYLQAGSFREMFLRLLSEKDGGEAGKVIWLMWNIWKARCSAVFEGKAVYVGSICARTLAAAEEYGSAYLSLAQLEPHTPFPIKWEVPAHGVIKCNVDASATAEASGIGLIFRDHFGAVLSAFSYRFDPGISVAFLEMRAIQLAMQQAMDLGYTRLQVESDCLLCIQRLWHPTSDHTTFGCLASDCVSLSSNFSFILFSFVKRTGNVPAHLLARHGLVSPALTVWDVLPPFDVLSACLAEIA